MADKREYKNTRIPVDAYDRENNFVGTYVSISSAAKETGCGYEYVRRCIHGIPCSTKKYKFSKYGEPICMSEPKNLERHVNMFDLGGKYIATFRSCTEASKVIFGSKTKESTISLCARNEKNSCGGYLWSYSETPDFSKTKYTKVYPKPRKIREVDMLDLDGNFIKHFTSASEALKEVKPDCSYYPVKIRDACRGTAKSAYGYKWRYTS